jgi:hypothetical protein
VAAVRKIATLDRAKVRAEFEQRFTCERMACEYVEIYQALSAASAAARVKSKRTNKADRLNLPLRADELVLEANEQRGGPSSLASREAEIAESSVRKGLR